MVAVGGKHSVAVTEDGAVYSWGYGEFGRLGHNDTLPRLLPTRVLLDDTSDRHSKRVSNTLTSYICTYIYTHPQHIHITHTHTYIRVSMAECSASHTAVVTEM